MARSHRNQPRKKRPGQYHHGDLQRALLQEALQTIQTRGIEQLTLRAVEHPSHYRVMFGGFIESCSKDETFVQEATGAFQVLVDALVELQAAGLVRRDDPLLLARFVWAVVHGIAMLVIDGQIRDVDVRGDALNRYAVERIRDAITASV